MPKRSRRRRARELVPLDRAAAFYAQHLRSPRSPAAVRAAEYLASRGIHDAIRDQFKIGFAPTDDTALLSAARAAGFATKEMRDVGLVTRPRGGGPLQDRFRGRLMFPVCDLQGRVLGFGARKLGNARGPKYVNSPAGAIYSKGQLLFGAHHARAAAAKAGAVIVVEGYLDALAMHQAGICNTVALMGTAATEHQIAALKRLAPSVVLMLDGDEAGGQATIRAGALAQRAGMTTLVASLPDGGDPPPSCNVTALMQHMSWSPGLMRSRGLRCNCTSNAPTPPPLRARTASSPSCGTCSRTSLRVPCARSCSSSWHSTSRSIRASSARGSRLRTTQVARDHPGDRTALTPW